MADYGSPILVDSGSQSWGAKALTSAPFVAMV